MNETRSLEVTMIGTSKGKPHALNIPGCTMENCINGIDAFCAGTLWYGDQVTSDRIQKGNVISWIFNLDGMEVGRFYVVPSRNGVLWKEQYSLNTLSGTGKKDPSAVPEILLFYDIMEDLSDHLYEYLGLCEPANRIRPARPKFWSKHLKEIEKPAQDTKGQGQPPIWEQIIEHLWDRTAIKMWCNGSTNSEIAPKVNVTPKSVTNRISHLRQIYPFIPTKEQVRIELIKTHDTG